MKTLTILLCCFTLTGCTVMRDQLGYEPIWPAKLKGK